METDMVNSLYNQSNIITIERHILAEQNIHPEATGVLTNILYDLALAGKFIASQHPRRLIRNLGRKPSISEEP
jgi:hypothetical protein